MVKQYITPFLDANLAMKSSGNWYYYTQDGLGSVRTLTDASGTLQNSYETTAFGEDYASTENVAQRYTYTGREKTELQGFGAPIFYRYRMYLNNLGRFISRDIQNLDVDLNLYYYVKNRPASLYDPDGRIPRLQYAILQLQTLYCGEVHFKVQWRLSGEITKPGFVLQYIESKLFKYDCDGKSEIPNPPEKSRYWEAWEVFPKGHDISTEDVEPRDIRPLPTDEYGNTYDLLGLDELSLGDQGCCTKGSYVVNATAEYIDDQKLPVDFVRRNTATDAKDVRSTVVPPRDWGRPGDPPIRRSPQKVERTVAVKWY